MPSSLFGSGNEGGAYTYNSPTGNVQQYPMQPYASSNQAYPQQPQPQQYPPAYPPPPSYPAYPEPVQHKY